MMVNFVTGFAHLFHVYDATSILSDISIRPMACVNTDHHECRRKHVVLAILVMSFLQLCIVKSMGVLLPVLLDQFTAHTRNVGVVVSLTFFCGDIIHS